MILWLEISFFEITMINEVFMFVLNILRHCLLSTNRPEGWVQNVWAWVRIVWVQKIHGYETTGYPMYAHLQI